MDLRGASPATGGARVHGAPWTMTREAQYRLYSKNPCSLVDTYDTREAALNKMYAISYDCDPKEFFYLKHGEKTVWPEQRKRATA